ncbi:universal stress protein [Flavivirga rizhaonensis]|uniref:Universal stress protein n=1 Tax=Flavivirga rizhaonensis TaxID=2559571 RepID=A0A4S1E2S6_9FLAO|nr:universal stress protein [Flavivirga rizhaonensis]TGV04849.1 universal stress protein [Flavivirga rizhaonensis]
MKLLENILLADDFSKSSDNVLQTAIELAKVMQSKITPIHILPDDIVNEKVKTLLNETALVKLNETMKIIENAGVEVGEPILEFGSISDSVVRSAIDVKTNLILIGSGEGQRGNKFQLGTTAERIIQKSEKPVFVVKEGILLNVQNILCPVDFSESSKRALKNAITMARRFRAELTILGVCELQGSTWFASETERAEENYIRCAQHKAQFNAFLEEFNLTELNWSKETPKGNPAEEILSAISRKMVDLLVMGTAGRTGLNRLIMGSVTEKVVREVPCSFLTLKSEDVISLQLENDIKDIEMLYKTGTQLMEDGFYEDSIEQFKSCLSISNMHVPAYFAIAKVYDKTNEPEKAKRYRNNGREIKDRIWYSKIEEEVRKLRGS